MIVITLMKIVINKAKYKSFQSYHQLFLLQFIEWKYLIIDDNFLFFVLKIEPHFSQKLMNIFIYIFMIYKNKI